jgi:hypothetical protein
MFIGISIVASAAAVRSIGHPTNSDRRLHFDGGNGNRAVKSSELGVGS